ncbi:MAG TPA: flagellar basal-body MS-ring/collar protein FliF [Accumulibacter sp.]|nr:flagellar basal-body MS-ring/collar protein FliF [Accumulibacter sp.]HMW19205.1 flagellar basal-body MS-ring/collar protein FliF [Accumulibacter sp.]HMX22578.1 flagellar basal-body MS-ring/collar protein FliF [Accumulibacter sp.]HNC16480.1 flagellar basal-body MS-ring/collar protein FliF [Accumulibacter sp.]HND79072.1 flagellar basal-body MS-ring/collar protein FliF [Accumulibacter sp.]
MATADTEIPETTAAVSPLDRAREALARLSNRQKVLLMVALAAVIALLVVAALMFRQSDYKILFSNVTERDGGAIIAALEQMNVPFKFNDSGSAILVPANRVHDIRLRLATQGLPRGGAVGFELMEAQKFGISQFAEQINYQRGLEGELARTIQSIGAVQLARVHLAIPKPSVFMREEQKPSASVLLNLYPGRTLEPLQIAGIQNLVAASVPQLAPSAVTLLDQSGALISQVKSKLLEAGLDPTQVKYIQEVEASIIKRVEDILTPIVGAGNFRVQIAADIDFSQAEQTAETHRPNTTPPEISIRSQQTSETASTNPSAQGVPGALTNQPPVPATAPLTQPPTAGTAGGKPAAPVPGQINAAGVQAPIASVGQPLSTSKNSTINYEVDKTIRHVKQALGTIKRLSAAVVINQRKEPGKDGKLVNKPLPEAEVKQINDLVKEAMGFSNERGDTLSVANAPFTVVEKDDSLPVWRDPETRSIAIELFKYAAIAAIIAYLLLGVVRPLVRTMLPPPPIEETLGGRVDVVAGGEDEENIEEEGENVVLTAAELLEKKIAELRALAQQDPHIVAAIIKEWMGANGS